MNNKVNYTFVGSVVLGLIAALVLTVYWMMRPTNSKIEREYAIYFNESVSGLNINSPVKYRGVVVGKVKDIRISSKNNKEIEVIISLRMDTPVKESTTATLNAQGITGLVFIDLSLGDTTSPDLIRQKDEIYPIIRSKPSLFKRVESSVGNITEKMFELLNEKNQHNIAMTLDESQKFMKKMNTLFDDKSIDHLQKSFASLDEITYKMKTTLIPKMELLAEKGVMFSDKVTVAMQSVASSYKVIQASMAEINRAVASGEFNVKEITKSTLKNIDDSLNSMQNVMQELDGMLKKYENSPNDILFEKQEHKKGPGE